MVLCINSSRIIVLDVASDPVAVRHELKTWRRPLNATILDDGSLLAVVSSGHQINIYSLSSEAAKHIQVLALNDVPRAMALSPTGSLLAVAYDNGIEVYALGQSVLSNERRAVQCIGLDSISFSSDGTMILGSSVGCGHDSIVTITVPFSTEAEAGVLAREAQTRLWTTQVLFPRTIEGYSHASLLPSHAEGDGNWVLSYDSRAAAFRATKTNNANSGAAYFISPVSSELQGLSPFMVPSADSKGEVVALGFQECGVWVYGLPGHLDVTPSSNLTMGPLSNETRRPAGVRSALQDSAIRLEQSLSKPKVLISGHQMIEMPGITAACWVQLPPSIAGRRLVAVAPGGVNLPTIGEEDVPVDGGRVLVLDFERSPRNGEINELEIEIGDAVPKILSEPDSSLDTEIELERRRTLLHRNNTSAPRPRPRPATRVSHPPASRDQKLPPTTSRNRSSSHSNGSESSSRPPIPDIPYDNTQPRSRDTLQRASTAAATHGRYRPRETHEADHPRRGLQIPHESDADNWVPPPPPYTRHPEVPLPEDLGRTLVPTVIGPVHGTGDVPSQIQRARTTRLEHTSPDTPSRTLTSLQRLNTITGSRLTGRTRRNRVDSEAHPIRRERSILHRRRESSGRPPPVPHILPAQRGPAPEQIPVNDSPSSNRYVPAPASPPAPHVRPHNMEEQRIAEDEEWQLSAQLIQNAMSGMTAHPFSISTPELHVPEPAYAQGEVHDESPAPQSFQRQNTLLSSRRMGSQHRRVSTDPTHSQGSDWRRRIEEWNEHAIYERTKKHRNKCIVM